MKKIIFVLLTLIVFGCSEEEKNYPISSVPSVSDQLLLDAFQNGETDLQVGGNGLVIALLPDDTTGSQHQKFILELATGQTLLVSHNIDLAPRVDLLGIGDSVEFYGEYEWNEEGGVIHWTHKDPSGNHTDGWLRYNDELYQ